MGMTEIILQDFTLAPFHLSDTKIGKRDEKSKLFQLKDVKGNVKKKHLHLTICRCLHYVLCVYLLDLSLGLLLFTFGLG